MNTGVPKKEKTFEILADSNERGDCILHEATLYVMHYFYSEDGTETFRLNEVDLDGFNGGLLDTDFLFESNEINVGYLQKSESYLLLNEDFGVILDADQKASVVFRESDVVENNWKPFYDCFTVGELYVRQVDGENPHLGMDIVNIKSKSIVGHIKAEFDFFQSVSGGLIAGNRVNNNFAIFSIERGEYVCELESESYFGCKPKTRIHCSHSNNQIALAYNNSIVVLSLDTYEVIRHINCIKHESMQAAIEQYQIKESKLMINGISMFGDRIVVHGGDRISYVMSIDISNESESIQWVCQGFGGNGTHYVGGDLIFGVQEQRPVAWDLYTGELIWEASCETLGNKIQIGDGWVVYSSLAGYIQCFNWKKPYISPHRPSV